ncbi:MAG: HAD family hydrolase [Candidatus Woesearchaeota archaeon]|nr:HAD family hydrolase [Candidatus Woesearchaeota archaeon]
MIFNIPHKGTLEIDTLVFDLNGTLSVHGILVEGVSERIEELKTKGYRIVLVTGDIRGNASRICQELGIELRIAAKSEDKAIEIQKLGKNCAAIGNARLDIGLFKHAKIRIATLQAEGIHIGIMPYIDIIVTSVNDALDLFLKPESMVGTLRE